MIVRRCCFALLWVLSLVGISYYGGAVSYGLFWGLTMIPVLSLIYLVLVFRQFRIYQEIESRTIVCRRPMPYYFVLPNETFFAFASIRVKMFSGLSYVADIPDNEEYELLPDDRYEYRTKMICRYRGEYEVGIREVILTDFFGLFRLRYKNPGTIKALVYPRTVHMQEMKSLEDVINISNLETAELQVQPDVITRDYMDGDPLKLIHWTLSAREQKLKTRLQQGEQKQDIVILYDTQRYDEDMYIHMPVENRILETVLALGVFFADKNVPYTVYADQGSIYERRVNRMDQFEMLYEDTAHIAFAGSRSLAGLLQGLWTGGTLWQAGTVILVAYEPSDRLMQQLEEMTAKGISILLYIVSDGGGERYMGQSSSRLKIQILPIEGNPEDIL
ncbi:MAG: DUF58 domain-containing protein [Lachnospiraceae bacterium]|nr:DUF58 domain-containing protein [Lachnospiraceae bacterium]